MKNIKKFLVLALVLVTAGLFMGCEASATADSYVILDINPSVELIVSPKDKVIHANPLNEDAEILLVDLELVGMNLDEAIDLIIETAIELGFISTDEEAETIVTVELINDNDKVQERKRDELKEKINKSFQNRGLLGKAKDKEFGKDLKEEANLYDVNPGFLRLAKEAVFLSDDLTLEEALELTRKELLDIVKEVRKENKNMASNLREEFLEAKELLEEEYRPQFEELKNQMATLKARLLEIKELLEDLEDEEAIALLVGEREELKLELEDLIVAFKELKESLKNDIKNIRDEFHEETEGLKEQLKEQKQNRKNEHHEKVKEFKDKMEERRKNKKDEIKDYQKGKNNEEEKEDGHRHDRNKDKDEDEPKENKEQGRKKDKDVDEPKEDKEQGRDQNKGKEEQEDKEPGHEGKDEDRNQNKAQNKEDCENKEPGRDQNKDQNKEDCEDKENGQRHDKEKDKNLDEPKEDKEQARKGKKNQ